MTEDTLYDRLGGHDGIRAVVDEFYDRLLDDDELGPFFAEADMEKLRATQTGFLCEAAGGPETYEAEPVRDAHLHIPFTSNHIQRALELLDQSLSTFDIAEEDADVVMQAIAEYEQDLLARPEGNNQEG